MGTSIVPEIIDAIVSLATTNLPDISVYDGYGVSQDPGDYLMVGVDNPDELVAAAQSATARQSWFQLGGLLRDEHATIWCTALSWNGDTDQKAARDSAFATMAAVENFCRADPTLGGLANLFWVEVGDEIRLSQNQNSNGAMAQVTFTVSYFGRF